MPDLDFTGLSEAAQAAFKPHFSDVVRRVARRRRSARMAGAALTVAAVAVAGAAAGLPGAGHPEFGGPAFEPHRTPDFIPTPGGTPVPGEVRSDDKAPTGPMVIGDLDHLYVRWHDCRSADDCALMVAATADGGATWRSFPLPVGRNAMTDVRAVGPRTLVAWAQSDPADGGEMTQTWHASADGGATWREVSPRTVDTIPAGWRVLDDFEYLRGGVTAVDPATGDVAALAPRTLSMAKAVAGLPPTAGLWVSGYLGTTTDPGTGPSGQDAAGRTLGTGSAVEVSRDGGRTWQRHAFTEDLVAADSAAGAAAIATDDGQLVYAIGRVDGKLRIQRSLDGGKTWQRTAAEHEVGTRPIQAAMGPDGRLVIQAGPEDAQPVLMFESRDGGATIQQLPVGPGGSAVQVPGGYAQSGWPSSSGAWLSADGTQWSFVDPPRVP
jgi:photosystem II stability/assembly factor-like uncharacterized protein